MNSHHRLIIVLGITCLLLGLLTNAAQMKVERAIKERGVQIKERSEKTSPAEESSSNASFSSLSNALGSQAALDALTRTSTILPQASTTFTVNSTADPGTGGCDSTECTLREAITAANAHVGADTIVFNIPGTGPHTITPTSSLPAITSPVTIDGYTQPGASANTLPDGDNAVLMIELDGSLGGAFGSPALLSINSGSSTVRGLAINRGIGLYGISVDTNGGNTIEGNFIGTNVTGNAALGNNQGVIVQFGSSNNLIGGLTPAARNIISGNSNGISIGGGTGNMIEGNFIGTDSSGSNDLGNVTGINLSASTNNTIGGTAAGARNVISGNNTDISSQADNTVIQGNYIGISASGGAFNYANTSSIGVSLFNSTSNTVGGPGPAARNIISGHTIGISLNGTPSPTVQGNFIGTDATGTIPLGNTSYGIFMQFSNNTLIGGTSAGAGNLISANGIGIQLTPGSTGAVIQVQGNLIGTDVNGTADLGNRGDGILIGDATNRSANITIGGTVAGARNIISGNDGDGIELRAVTGTVMQGNFIGTQINGTSPLGNSGHGIDLVNTSNNTIGGTTAGAGNRIAFNGASNDFGGGVIIDGLTCNNNSVRGNSIFANTSTGASANGGLGIDLSSSGGGNGPTLNDACDGDTGPNNLQNFPVITSATSTGSTTTVSGTLNSTANTTFTVEFFSNPSCDSTGYGEGQNFLGSSVVTTDGSCNANINVSLPVTLASGQVVTATATDPQGNSSEFSQCFQATRVNILTANNDAYVTDEDTVVNVPAPGVLSNDTSADPATLAAQLVTSPAHGALTLNQNGSFTYTPALNYNGSDSFTYRASDGTNTSNTANVQITINPVNDAPVADTQSLTTNEDTPKAITLTGTDVEGSSLTYSVVTAPAHGTLSGTAPNLTYMPTADYNGADAFTFKVNDGQLDSNVATVSITVNAVNDAPVASDQSITIDEDTSHAITLVASDIDNDPLTFSIVTNPTHGTVSGAGPNRTYTPAANYNGTDSFTFKANDGSVDSNIATIRLTINAVNDPPVAVNDAVSTNENVQLVVPAPGVLSNDTDVDSTSFNAIKITNPSHGTLSLNPDGSFIYAPNTNFNGTDSFTYRANDGQLDSNVATVTITVIAAPTPTPTPVPTPTPSLVQFSASNYSVVEGCTQIMITVNRIGDTATAASADYFTSDVTASERGDYIMAKGTLHFMAGETSKSLAVLINDDSYVEGDETFNVNLANPVGVSLGAPSIAEVTIIDNATGTSTNVVDDAQDFTCQHYHDFLNRQSDPGGLAFWSAHITACGFDQACLSLARVYVSAAYFPSIEFQQTGYFVERFYLAAYGNASGTSMLGGAHQLSVPRVRLHEFLPDTQEIGQGVVVGQTGWEAILENNKQAFALEFVQRSGFTAAFPDAMAPSEFVDRLFTNAELTPSASDRQAAINEFSSATDTSDVAARARALQRVVENSTLNNQEFNRAFVLMQYFGYLRRNPNDPPDGDYSGYDFWITKLNAFNGNYANAEMVKAFILSAEYRRRFGP